VTTLCSVFTKSCAFDSKQRIVSIVELRSQFHGTGGGIDLAVIAATRPVASILTLARS
jgi:hypothetical protein